MQPRCAWQRSAQRDFRRLRRCAQCSFSCSTWEAAPILAVVVTVGSGGTIEPNERDHHGRNLRSEKGRQIRADHQGQAAATAAAWRQQEVVKRNCPCARVSGPHMGSSVCGSATDLDQPERSGSTDRRRPVTAVTPTSPVGRRRWRRDPWAGAVTPPRVLRPTHSRPGDRSRRGTGHTRTDTERGQAQCAGRHGADGDGLQHLPHPSD